MKNIDLFVYDSNYILQGEISGYDSIEIERNMFSVSKMTIRVAQNYNSLILLQKGHVITIQSDPFYPYVIDHFGAITEKGREIIEVYAFSLNYFLSFRTLPVQTVIKGPVESSVKKVVTDNCISPTNPNRVIPMLELDVNTNIPGQVDIVRTGGNILTHAMEVLKEFMATIDIIFDTNVNGEVTRLLCKTWTGFNKTDSQNVFPPVLFSKEFNNVVTQNYFNSDMKLKTVSYVAGEGEGILRQVREVNDAVGIGRRELYVDARDLQSTYYDTNGDQQTLTPQEYTNSLIARGIQELNKNTSIETFDSVVNDNQFTLNRDYSIGDIVTFYDRELNLKKDVQVTTIKTTANKNGVKNVPSFGTGILKPILF
jgi:hypothetical protein